MRLYLDGDESRWRGKDKKFPAETSSSRLMSGDCLPALTKDAGSGRSLGMSSPTFTLTSHLNLSPCVASFPVTLENFIPGRIAAAGGNAKVSLPFTLVSFTPAKVDYALTHSRTHTNALIDSARGREREIDRQGESTRLIYLGWQKASRLVEAEAPPRTGCVRRLSNSVGIQCKYGSWDRGTRQSLSQKTHLHFSLPGPRNGSRTGFRCYGAGRRLDVIGGIHSEESVNDGSNADTTSLPCEPLIVFYPKVDVISPATAQSH